MTNQIVVVDDSVEDLEILARCHERSTLADSHDLRSFSSGPSFLEYMDRVKAGAEPMPSLVLLDINMPVMDGYETLTRLRATFGVGQLPVAMFVTNSDRRTDVERAADLNATMVEKFSRLSDGVGFFDTLFDRSQPTAVGGDLVPGQATKERPVNVSTRDQVAVDSLAAPTISREHRFLQELNRVSASPDLDYETRLRHLLDLGRTLLGLDLAIVSEIVDNDYRVLTSSPPGTFDRDQVLDFANTYCVLTFGSDEVKAWSPASQTEISDHPCYAEYGLEAYIGTTVFVDHQPFGTVNFTSVAARGRPFTDWECTFVDLLATSIGSEISRHRDRIRLERVNDDHELVLRRAGVGIWEYQIAEPAIGAWNDRCYSLLGYSKGEIKPTVETIFELLHPDDRDQVIAAIDRHLELDEPYEAEHRLRTKSGQYRWFSANGVVVRDADGKPTRMIGSIQDIEERVRAQERLRTVLADASIGYWDWSITGEPRVIDDTVAGLLGYEPGEVSINSYAEFLEHLHPDDVAPTQAAVQRHLDDSTPYEVLYRLRVKSGDYRWFRACGSAERDERGRPVRMVSSFQDVDDLVRARQPAE